MLCNELNKIYSHYIHESLVDDEFRYYYPIKEHFLDLLKQVNYISRSNNNNITYYINDDILLEVCDVFIHCWLHSKYFHLDKFVYKTIIENVFNSILTYIVIIPEESFDLNNKNADVVKIPYSYTL